MDDLTPTARWTTAQPWRGLFALAVTFFLALVITVSCNIDSYLGMVSIWIMCMVPIQLIMTIGWGGQYPPTGFLPQPWKGMALTLFMGLVGTVVAFSIVHMIGGGSVHPYVSAFVICCVVTTIIATTNFGLWPFQKLSVPARGLLYVVLVPILVKYGIKLFNFSKLSFIPGAPGPVSFYEAGGPPFAALSHLVPTSGPVVWETALTWYLWLAFLSFTWVMLDFWPFHKSPKIMQQPVMGFTVLITNMVLSTLIYKVGTGVFGLNPLTLMYCGISYAFGLLVVLVVFQKWPGRLIGGIAGNFVDLLVSIAVAVAAFHGVNAICAWHFGALPYPNNIFASATFMLGLNFPLWVAYCDLWQGWPLPAGDAPKAE